MSELLFWIFIAFSAGYVIGGYRAARRLDEPKTMSADAERIARKLGMGSGPWSESDRDIENAQRRGGYDHAGN